MWDQSYSPVANVYVSALLAVIPIVFFLVALTFLKMKGIWAALVTLVLQMIVSAAVVRMPFQMVVVSAVFGILSGLWPICYIIVVAVWLYRIAIRSGKFRVIRASIASVSMDQRIQVILIAFCFGGFLEGAAAFGTPIAICGAMLVELGFSPLKATVLALIANAAVGAYGAIGIPVSVGAQQADLDLIDMSRMMLPTVQIAVIFIPLIQVWIVDGFRGIRDTVPVWLGVGLINSGVQSLILYFMGPELTNIIAAVASMGYIIALMQCWAPKFIYREPPQKAETDLEDATPAEEPAEEDGGESPSHASPSICKLELSSDRREDPETISTVMNSTPAVSSSQDVDAHNVTVNAVRLPSLVLAEEEEEEPLDIKKNAQPSSVDLAAIGAIGIFKAWLPFILLTVTVLIWSMSAFKNLFAAGGAMNWAVIDVPMPWLNQKVIQTPPIKENVSMAAIWSITILNASGTAIVVAILLTLASTRQISLKGAAQELGRACKDLWKASLMICTVMAVAYMANFSGTSATIGLAISKVGRVFPLLCPFVGWLGVFITGSVVNNNVLFAKLQSVTASQIGVSPTLLVAANTAGGSMGKAVSPQSIAIAAAAVNMIGRESEIMSGTLKYSIILTVLVCVCTVTSSYIF